MTNKIRDELEKIVKEEANKGGFYGTIILEEAKENGGSVDLGSREIKIQYNPLDAQKNPDEIKKIIKALIRHEINHIGYKGLKGCPRNLGNEDKLLVEPMRKVALEKGYIKENCNGCNNDIVDLASYVEDVIVWADLSKKFSLDGAIPFLKEALDFWSGFGEAFVRLNLYLWGNKKQKKELKEYLTYSKEINNALKNFLEKTGISNLKQKIEIYEKGKKKTIEVKDRETIKEFLANEKNWPRIAEVFVEEFGKLYVWEEELKERIEKAKQSSKI
ncbi:MAG: hypothetical protein QXL88_00315 [Candidatus Pacearchaeota archaeon]